MDYEAVLSFAKEHVVLITVEEHQVAGGMGSAVAEYLSTEYPTKIMRLGVQDMFGQSGKQTELIEHYGMDKKTIIKGAKKLAE